jgi:hypothetical protein
VNADQHVPWLGRRDVDVLQPEVLDLARRMQADCSHGTPLSVATGGDEVVVVSVRAVGPAFGRSSTPNPATPSRSEQTEQMSAVFAQLARQ